MKTKAFFIGLLLTYVICVQAEDVNVQATILWYVEQEPGIDPYRVRYIVTQDYLRSDDGIDGQDFLLFDRGQRTIYSVVPQNRSVLQIVGDGAVSDAPPELAIRVNRHADTQAPRIGNKQPVKLELSAGDSVCKSAVVAPGLLEGEREVFLEFSQVLAAQQLRTLNNTPPELRTDCFLARYLYAHDFHFKAGMLIAEWSPQGERRELVDIEERVTVPASLFDIPDSYSIMQVGER